MLQRYPSFLLYIAFSSWLLLLGGCSPKEAPIAMPDVQPIPPSTVDEMTAFQAPSLSGPPMETAPAVIIHEPKPPGANEIRYTWEDGKASLVQVQIGYPTIIRLQPNERITSIVDGDRAHLNEQEVEAAKQQPQQEKNPQCSHGIRWQYCRGIAESQYTPIESVAFTATHPGHKSGFVVFTTQRTYALDLQAVARTKVRLITWDVGRPPFVPPPPPTPTLLPSGPRQYHVGYNMSSAGQLPEWAPRGVWSDLPTAREAKIYIQFAPAVIHSRQPLLRGMTEYGTPYLLNSRQYGEWVIVDELAPRLELRRGAGELAERVVVTREQLRTISCPGDEVCPHWPSALVR